MALATIIQIAQFLLSAVLWLIVIQAIMSWLIAFNVINTYNDFVAMIWRALDTITAPIYRPIRKIMPDLGGLDLSPMVIILLIIIVRDIVLENVLMSLSL